MTSDPTEESQRHPHLKGGINFRDFGGYRTADGGRVKWGKLFRSGHLARLTEECHAKIDALGIAAVCDFRSDAENTDRPSRIPDSLSENVLRLNIWPKSSLLADEAIRGLTAGRLTDADIHRNQDRVYREFATEFADRYGAMFRHIIAAGGRPVWIHCTVGKDRTGFGAALIQRALGVSLDDALSDYEMTNRAKNSVEYIRKTARRAIDTHGAVFGDDPDGLTARLMAMFGARRDSLKAAFDAIDEVAGSLDRYFSQALGVSDADRARMRGWFVE